MGLVRSSAVRSPREVVCGLQVLIANIVGLADFTRSDWCWRLCEMDAGSAKPCLNISLYGAF